VGEALEIEAVFGSLVRHIILCESDIATGVDADVITAAQDRLGSLIDVWRTALKERDIEDAGNPRDVMGEMHEDLASLRGLRCGCTPQTLATPAARQ